MKAPTSVVAVAAAVWLGALWCSVVAVLPTTQASATTSSSSSSSPPNHGLSMIPWLRDNGGYFSEKIEFRPLDGNDPHSPNGLFAKEDLHKDETIMWIPQRCLLQPNENKYLCHTTDLLVEQYQLGDQAFFKDYVQYLFDGHKTNRLPQRWSPFAHLLLQQIYGTELGLPPFNKVSYQKMCIDIFLEDDDDDDDDDDNDTTETSEARMKRLLKRNATQIEEDAYDFVISRSWTDVMIPLYDMVNHRNGKWRNVEATSAHEDQDVKVYAFRNIKAGEQLYISYNECLDDDCNDLFPFYGTYEILRDYGFVENYPQRWTLRHFHSSNERQLEYKVELDYIETVDKYDPTQNHTDYKITWYTDNRPDLQVISAMTSQIRRLKELESYLQEQTSRLVSDHERDTILEYYHSLMTVLQQVIWAVYEEYEMDPTWEDEYLTEEQVRTRSHDKNYNAQPEEDEDEEKEVSFPLYDTLDINDDHFVIGNEDEDSLLVCKPIHGSMAGDGTYKNELYKVDSQYQNIAFYYSRENDDTCLYLEGWGQTCTSFRPYHEILVHYPASFVKEVKRIAYVGGGDNMILHEILKYESIELVVGMELDQQVVRYSFMNYGTLPYFDDPRVQWWFGDASKSLLMLPDDYYGSFDLVLIDLQTFVADVLYVTPELTLMDTLKLLLKPNGQGIIAKNEDFPKRQVTDFAKYVVDMEFCNIKQLCQQSVSFGSDGINFMEAPRYKHDIDTLFLIDNLEEEGRFNNWFHYHVNAKNETKPTEKKQEEENPVPAVAKNAVLVIIEADNLKVHTPSKEYFVDSIRKALKGYNMDVVSIRDAQHYDSTAAADGSGEGSTTAFDVVLLLREGYIAIRRRQKEDYLAIDLLLWDATNQVNDIKTSIINSIGGNEQTSTDSYRFVTGGVNGIGEIPSLFQCPAASCLTSPTADADVTVTEDVPITDRDKAIIWKELIQMIPHQEESEGLPIVVVCGPKKDGESCSVLDALQEDAGSGYQVIPVYTCDNLTEGSKDDDNVLFECEAEIMKQLRTYLHKDTNKKKKICGLWIDSTITQPMGRVVLRLLSSKIGRSELLERGYVIAAEHTADTWKGLFFQRFATEVSPFHPASELRLSFGTDVEIDMFSSHDDDLYPHLNALFASIEERTGTPIGSVAEVMAGHAPYVPDFNVPTFTDSMYKNQRATQQYVHQKAIGYQTIFQFELQAPKTILQQGEEVLWQYHENVWTGRWAYAKIHRRHDDDETYDVYSKDYGYETDVGRDLLRRLDYDASTDPPPTLDVGTRVLIGHRDDEWTHGFVNSMMDDGRTYLIRGTDGHGTFQIQDIEDLMPMFESPNEEALTPLSIQILEDAVLRALEVGSQTSVELESFAIGDGCVITAFWEKGNAILVWDGGKHFDINYYLDDDDEVAVDDFLYHVLDQIPYLKCLTRDEQPRGYNHVVNFGSMLFKLPH